MYFHTKKAIADSLPAKARILSLREISSSNISYHRLDTKVTFHDQLGKEVESSLVLFSDKKKGVFDYKIDDIIEILFNKDDPKKIMENSLKIWTPTLCAYWGAAAMIIIFAADFMDETKISQAYQAGVLVALVISLFIIMRKIISVMKTPE